MDLENNLTFISYAQNHEDVLLWRALKHIDKGFYIDVGACFPVDGSVTKLFYDLGWHGINIEPHPEAFRQLILERTHDINLELAISDSEGEIEIFEGNSIGETSAIKKSTSEKSFLVKSMPLRKVCEKYITGDISFIKIDVEGLELNVIKSGDWCQFRPKIVVCEITQPWSNEKRSDENQINIFFKDNKYQFVYFDGINSYYVANEEKEIISKLSYQPNIIDDYISYTEFSLQKQISELKNQNAFSQGKLNEFGILFSNLQSENEQLRLDNQHAHLERVYLLEQLSNINIEKVLMVHESSILKNVNESINNKLQQLQSEHDGLLQKIDDFWQENKNIRLQLDEVYANRNRIQLQYNEVWAHRDHLLAELKQVYQSRSFRITAPMRFIMGKARIVKGKMKYIPWLTLNVIPSYVKSRAKQILGTMLVFMMKIFRKIAPRSFNRIAKMKWLRRIYTNSIPKPGLYIVMASNNKVNDLTLKIPVKGQKASIEIDDNLKKSHGNTAQEKLQNAVSGWQLGDRNIG